MAALALLLAGCASAPPQTAAPAVAIPAATPAPPPDPEPEPEPAAPPPAPAPPPATTRPEAPAGAQEVLRALGSALDALQAGREDAAEAELRRVLVQEPGNRLALSLMRQMREDPQTLLGRESFSYRVQPGESLSRLALRFLNDGNLFYALARYNRIRVPRTLAGGVTLRIPGKAPPMAAPSGSNAAPPPPASPATATAAVVAQPVAIAPAAAAADTDDARTARTKAETVARQTRAARAAFAKQDLDGALRAWEAVLAVDADNRTALLERQKVLGLKERLGQVK